MLSHEYILYTTEPIKECSFDAIQQQSLFDAKDVDLVENLIVDRIGDLMKIEDSVEREKELLKGVIKEK